MFNVQNVKQNFKVTLETPFSILIAAVVIIVLLVNVCLYIFKPDINFLYMAGVMLVGIIAIIVMLPLVIRYVKPENVKYSTKTTRFKNKNTFCIKWRVKLGVYRNESAC